MLLPESFVAVLTQEISVETISRNLNSLPTSDACAARAVSALPRASAFATYASVNQRSNLIPINKRM